MNRFKIEQNGATAPSPGSQKRSGNPIVQLGRFKCVTFQIFCTPPTWSHSNKLNSHEQIVVSVKNVETYNYLNDPSCHSATLQAG